MEIALAALTAIILWLVGLNISLKYRLYRTAILYEKLHRNQNKDMEAFIVLNWYVQKASLMSIKLRQYKEALIWYHDKIRLGELGPDHEVNKYYSTQAFMSYLHDKGVFTQDWYTKDKGISPFPISIKSALDEIENIRKLKGIVPEVKIQHGGKTYMAREVIK